MKRVAICLGMACTMATVAHAQLFSQFHVVTNLTGVSAQSSAAGSVWTVSLAQGASLDYLGTTYQVADLYGFWIGDSTGALQASGHRQNGWRFDADTSVTGSSFGWHTYPRTGLHSGGEPLTFAFQSLSGTPEGFGFEVRLAEPILGTEIDTMLVRGDGPLAPVPEPATVGLGIAGLLAVLRRRR